MCPLFREKASLPAEHMLRYFQLIIIVVLLAGLTGCGGKNISPGSHRSAVDRSVQYRTVIRGDTMFSISWDIGVDFRTLARWNNIKSPYLIRPGQRLRITAPTVKRATKSRKKSNKKQHVSTSIYRVKRGDSVYSIARKTGNSPKQIIRRNKLRKPYTIRVGQRLKISSSKSRVAVRGKGRSKTRYASRHKKRTSPTNKKIKSVGRWVWPAKGKIIRRFTQNGTNKGVDISGRLGAPIYAAAGGRVVYQGSGLRGYGKLIIVKHNSDYLSAYAHCASILVKEGSRVKRGQRIATMGRTGTSRVKLHFEIRQRGNPVNPLRYLPAKS